MSKIKYVVLATPPNATDRFENFIALDKYDRSIPEDAIIEEGTMDKQVGDTVACKAGHNLEIGHDGLNRDPQINKLYPYGVCTSVNPFVIISEDGKHMWQRKNPAFYYSLHPSRHVKAPFNKITVAMTGEQV